MRGLARTACALRGALLLALLAFGTTAGARDPAAQPEAASGWQAVREVQGREFMVVTANPLASEAAADLLRQGGTAADAAIAAQLVLNLVEPQSSGLGGGAFALYHEARSQRLHALDGRETAPVAARADRFLDAAGEPLDFFTVAASGRSVGVPGVPALLEHLHRHHGRLPWARLFAPALQLAETGFAMSPRLHRLLAEDRFLPGSAAARALYYEADGTPRAVGSRIVNPAFAALLRELAAHGMASFYRGRIARDLVAAVRDPARLPGDLSEADLAAYRVIEREPVCGWRLGVRVCGMPPPSSGGIAVLQLLTFCEPLTSESPLSLATVHRFAEAGRLVFADRARYLADDDFVAVPQASLLDARYLAERGETLRATRSLGRARPGRLPDWPAPLDEGDGAPERPSTTHLSIVDAEGNAISMTSSIEGAFGSRILVHGFLLNSQLTDFSFRPVARGRLLANRVEPGKRPLSSMNPTITFDRRGRVASVLGSPGGARIINYVAQTLLAVHGWQLPPAQAVALPHYGSRNGPTELERGTAAADLQAGLQGLGHAVRVDDMTSGLALIVRRPGGGWIGVADPRREGRAVSEAGTAREIGGN